MSQARWVEQRMERVLPTHAFHVVFTLPSELHGLVMANRDKLFNLLFASATEALLELGRDPRWLGAHLGITSVLHTWTRDLRFHPHAHCIVTGGGLSLDGERWIATRPNFLLPVRVLGALFRGKFLARLALLHDRGELRLEGPATRLADPARFARVRDKLYRCRWVVYAKRPFGGPEQVFRYQTAYTTACASDATEKQQCHDLLDQTVPYLALFCELPDAGVSDAGESDAHKSDARIVDARAGDGG
jgi:hypothetical protein